MTPQAQERIARWMGMRKARNGPLWFKRLSHDTCRLPDPNTIEGAALWCVWLEAEILCRDWSITTRQRVGRADVQIFERLELVAMGDGPTKLAALTAATLKLMEVEG